MGDWLKGTNVNGFTLLTPLQEKNDINLVYYDVNKKKRRYTYMKGVGVVFGENFIHSTDLTPLRSNQEVVFCFSFGTDKDRYWDVIKNTAAEQGNHYMHPILGFIKTNFTKNTL